MSSAAEQVLVHCAALVSMRPSTMASNIANEERIRTEPRQPRVIPRFTGTMRPDYFICEAQRPQGFSDKPQGARARDFRLGGAKRKVTNGRRVVKDLPQKPMVAPTSTHRIQAADTRGLSQNPKITPKMSQITPKMSRYKRGLFLRYGLKPHACNHTAASTFTLTKRARPREHPQVAFHD